MCGLEVCWSQWRVKPNWVQRSLVSSPTSSGDSGPATGERHTTGTKLQLHSMYIVELCNLIGRFEPSSL